MKLFIAALIGIMLIVVGLGMETEEAKNVEINECGLMTYEFVRNNSVNFIFVEQEHEYPVNWFCVNISNAYMTNNPEWRSFSFCVDCVECKKENDENVTIGHVVNYQIINDRFYVHDETWGCEYEFEDWRNMSLQLRDYGEEATLGNHSFYVNVNEY